MSLNIDQINETFEKVINKDTEEIENRFTYHAPVVDQVDRYSRMRNNAKMIAYVICDICPPSRERSLAITKLDEVVFWANAAIARNK